MWSKYHNGRNMQNSEERVMDKQHAHVIDNIPSGGIAPSMVHGSGLFALRPVSKGEILGVLDGQVMGWDAYDQLVTHLNDTGVRFSELFLEWNCLTPDTLLVRPFRTKYSFINHSRIPNLALAPFPLRVVALRDIEEGEEFFLDYRKEPLRSEYLEGHGKTYL